MYFKEIIDEFNCGKKIRRASWPIGVTISRNFDSEELAKKAIETIGEDRIKKYYFGVEDE